MRRNEVGDSKRKKREEERGKITEEKGVGRTRRWCKGEVAKVKKVGVEW